MNPTGKVERCIHIAAEYRGAAELRNYSEQGQRDKEQELTWRAAIPNKWASTLGGKVVQVLLIPFLFPFVLFFIYVIAPLLTLARKKKSAKRALRHGETLITANIESLARASSHTNLFDLWLDHGLPKHSSVVDVASRRECLERWVDILYGSGMAVTMRVKQRVEEEHAAQGKTMAEFRAQGGHISFVDPVDSVARELAGRLPTFRPSSEG